ncbi:MAG TPA: ATP-dependent 6-phosphofructokinase [Polyangiaceae bacterium]|nr:ATP-dependent 6-phosphofructokinase [Polyangiaceae bacterium]
MNTPNLGTPRFSSHRSHTTSEEVRIPQRIEVGADPGSTFELAGPRAQLFFEGPRTRAGIVTCGGLCPGLNNVIRSAFLELHYGYGVAEVIGFRGGYAGLDPDTSLPPVVITPELVDSIHLSGGTILGSSRGPVDIGRAVDNLIARNIDMLFTVGGDGTQRGANALFDEASRRGHRLAVVGIPKTIDNDVQFVSRTFGFMTAVEEAVRVIQCAHTEVRSVPGGIAVVKLMGRHAGFITVGATVASQDVNFALIPEVPFELPVLLTALERRMRERSHAVIAVAEGAGQELFAGEPAQRDASGNVKLRDIGQYLRTQIESHFAARAIPAVLRYFDPSYLIRSRPANCEDAVLCDQLARHAVHAAMAGKTGLVIGFLHDRFIHVPIALLTAGSRRVDPAGDGWRSVLAATGQPRLSYAEGGYRVDG